MRADLTSPDAFAALVREHERAVFRTLTRMCGAAAPIEDLAQEVFLRLYRALPEFRGDSALSTYLYRITVNVAQDEWKRRRREREHIAPIAFADEDSNDAAPLENFAGEAFAGEHTRTPEQRLATAELQASIDAALLDLPERERAVLVLFHQEELSYEGVAAALGVPVNTVRTHLHRGRARLREALKACGARPNVAVTYAGKAGLR